jgi:hypothetical protein
MTNTAYIIALMGKEVDSPIITEIQEVHEDKKQALKALEVFSEDLEMMDNYCPELEWFELIEVPFQLSIPSQGIQQEKVDHWTGKEDGDNTGWCIECKNHIKDMGHKMDCSRNPKNRGN